MKRTFRILGKAIPAWALAVTLFLFVAGVALALQMFASIQAAYLITQVGIDLAWHPVYGPPMSCDPFELNAWVCDHPSIPDPDRGWGWAITSAPGPVRISLQVIPSSLEGIPGVENGEYLYKYERYDAGASSWQEVVPPTNLYNIIPGHSGSIIQTIADPDDYGGPSWGQRVCFKSTRYQSPFANTDLTLYIIGTLSADPPPPANQTEMLPYDGS